MHTGTTSTVSLLVALRVTTPESLAYWLGVVDQDPRLTVEAVIRADQDADQGVGGVHLIVGRPIGGRADDLDDAFFASRVRTRCGDAFVSDAGSMLAAGAVILWHRNALSGALRPEAPARCGFFALTTTAGTPPRKRTRNDSDGHPVLDAAVVPCNPESDDDKPIDADYSVSPDNPDGRCE